MEKGYLKGKKVQQVGSRPLRILKANMYAYMVTTVFLLITAILMTHTSMGMGKERLIIIIGVMLSTFIAGADTAKGEIKNGWRWGILGAGMYGLIYFTVALLASKSSLLLCTNSLVMICIMLCSGAVGGMVAINMKK